MLLSTIKNAYVFGVFDCCRNEFKEVTQSHKGSIDTTTDMDDRPKETNCIFLYRCFPNETAEVSSVFAISLFKKLSEAMDQ